MPQTLSLTSEAEVDADTTTQEAPAAPSPLFGISHQQDPLAEVVAALTLDDAKAIALRRAREAAEAPQPPPPTREEKQQQQADALTGYLARLGFPVENWQPEWEGLPQEWRGRVKAYTGDLASYVRRGCGMVAAGQKGSGKSSLFALIARAAQAAEIDCAYVLDGRTLIYQCQLIDRRSEARAGSFDALGDDLDLRKHWPHENVPLVFCDDIDYIPGGGYDPEREAWDRIGAFLYARMARGMATCLATNQTPQDLFDRPGMERVKDRATVYLPQSLWVVTQRPTQRGAHGGN